MIIDIAVLLVIAVVFCVGIREEYHRRNERRQSDRRPW